MLAQREESEPADLRYANALVWFGGGFIIAADGLRQLVTPTAVEASWDGWRARSRVSGVSSWPSVGVAPVSGGATLGVFGQF